MKKIHCFAGLRHDCTLLAQVPLRMITMRQPLTCHPERSREAAQSKDLILFAGNGGIAPRGGTAIQKPPLCKGRWRGPQGLAKRQRRRGCRSPHWWTTPQSPAVTATGACRPVLAVTPEGRLAKRPKYPLDIFPGARTPLHRGAKAAAHPPLRLPPFPCAAGADVLY